MLYFTINDVEVHQPTEPRRAQNMQQQIDIKS